MWIFLGWKKVLEEERSELLRAKYVDPIENFPKKVDQLLTVITRVGFVLISLNGMYLIGFFSFT